MPSSTSFPCMDLESPSSSTSGIHSSPRRSSRRTLPYRAVSQQFELPPDGPRGRRSSTRRAIRRLSQLFHRVRDQFIAHIPLWSPIETPSLPLETPASAPGNLVGMSSDSKDPSPFDLDDPKSSSVIQVDDELDQQALEIDLKNSDQYIIKEDFNATESDQISVLNGDKVELLDRFATPDQEFVAVAVIDEETKKPSQKRGNVPFRILFSLDNVSEASCSTTDRPQVEPPTPNNHSPNKRTSIRRFFQNSNSRESKSQQQQQQQQQSSSRESPQSTASSRLSGTPAALSLDQQQQASSGTPPSDLQLQSPSNNQFEYSLSSPTAAAGSSFPAATTTTTSETFDMSNNSGEMPETMDEAGVATSTRTITTEDPLSPSPDENGTEKIIDHIARSPSEEARFKRQFVIQELVETEQHYVTDLGIIVDGYMEEINNMELPEDLQGKDKIIFANIQQILEFHKTCFVKEIEKCLENYEAAGLAFVKYERRLHTYYVKYCQNKPTSDFLMAQEQFQQFFNDIRIKLGERRNISDLLIKPVQRIQKYNLLMKDIRKYTLRAGDPMEALDKGFEIMNIVPKACDDMMQVGRLQNFNGNLNSQGKLLFQGLLQISDAGPSQPFKGKERIVFLFEQSCIIADSIPKRNEFSSPTYIFKNQIMVNKMVLENNVSDEPLRFVLRSNDPNQPIAFLCQATSEKEKEEWLSKINAQLDQQKTLLAALVDPKKYQSQLASSMGSMSLANAKKDSSGSLGCPSGTGSPTSSLNSPKHSTPPNSGRSSKLFGFGKKSAPPVAGGSSSSRNPTSPH